MDLAGKLDVELALKSSSEKSFKFFSSQIHKTTSAFPDKIHAIEVHEGDWETADGKPEVFKEKVEIDETNKSVSLIAVDGHVFELYKSYKLTSQFIAKQEDDDLVKITVNYEKLKADVEAPTKYLDFVVKLVKEIDAYLVELQGTCFSTL